MFANKANPLMLASLTLTLIGSACMTPGVYRSARVLEKGHSDLSVAIHPSANSISSYQSDGKKGPASTMLEPGLSPDFSYHVGVSQNVELGARVQPLIGFLEFDSKVRLIGDDDSQFHLALQPAIGVQPLLAFFSAQATLPVLATYEINDMLSLTGYGYGQVAKLGNVLDADILSGVTNTALGLGTSLEVHGDSLYMMPFVNISSETTFDSGFSNPTLHNDKVMGGVAIGWHGDLLHSIDEKITKLSDDVKKGFSQTNDNLDQGFGRVEKKLDGIDSKVQQLDQDVEKLKNAPPAAQPKEAPVSDTAQDS